MPGEWNIDDGLFDFNDYIVTTSTAEVRDQIGREPECVADYVQAWVRSKRGVYACVGDFQVYLLTFLAITGEWASDPDAFSYVPPEEDDPIVRRRPETVFGRRFGGSFGHPAVSAHYFATQTFRALHGKRPAEA